MSQPFVSVVTVSFNAEKHIEQTICSVLNQTYKNFEYIIVDGKSTDDTLNIINRYRNKISHILSEKDTGIADALNKGISLAKGDYIIFLHADDYFTDDRSLENTVNYIDEGDEIIACDILYGHGQTFDRLTPRGFNFWIHFKTGIYHQGSLCSRHLLNRLQGFDTQFKIVMDYDFFLRAYQSGIQIKKIPHILSVMRDTGLSAKTDWPSLKQRFQEERKVHEKNCRSKMMERLYNIYWILYIPYRRIRV